MKIINKNRRAKKSATISHNGKKNILIAILTTLVSSLFLQFLSGVLPISESILKVTKPIKLIYGEFSINSEKYVSTNILEVEFSNYGFKKGFIPKASLVLLDEQPGIEINVKQINSDKIGWLSAGIVRVTFTVKIDTNIVAPKSFEIQFMLFDEEGYGWLSDTRFNLNIYRGPIPFTWLKNPRATYNIHQVALDSLFTNIVSSINTADTFCFVNNLKPFTKYYWRVKGGNSVGEGDWSKISRFTTGR